MGKCIISRRFSVRLDWRSCGSDTRKNRRLLLQRVKWRNHIQDLMHPPWSFLARGQSMRGARSVDSMHCWFIALWISCIYDHFVNNNVSFWLFFYYLVNRSTRWSALCQRLTMLFWYGTHNVVFFLHLQQPHTNLTLDQLQQQLLIHSAFEHLNIFSLPATIMYFMMYVYTLRFTCRLLQKCQGT